MRRRPEIDGLRAIAVLPVIFCHAGFSWFRGGFVGVDVFFVISGFLISNIIYTEATEGRFSVISFYERRVRRIIPALAVVTIASFIAALFTMLPDALDNFAQSVVATFLFSNNILLTLTSGYWDLTSSFKPLLHTWSLGVEEEFYIFYPLLVLLIVKFRRSLFAPALIVGGLASFGLSVLLTGPHPNASFYLIHTRAWELFLGALAAYFVPSPSSGRLSGPLSLLGLVLILAAVVGLTETMPYPSYYAALPCLGTALVLMFAAPETIANRLLSLPILVGIGLISYSAYLWHQPLFAYARIMSLSPPPQWLMATLAAVTIGLAYLSWKYVEEPCRNKRRISRGVIFSGAALVSCSMILAGLVVFRAAGLPERIPGIGLGHGRYISYNERVFKLKKDRFTSPDLKHLLVVGDSTARDVVNTMIESHRFGGFEIIYRDDVSVCGNRIANEPHGDLIDSADAIVAVATYVYDGRCTSIPYAKPPLSEKPFVLIGPKHFGYNLNAYIRVPRDQRPSVRARLLDQTLEADARFRMLVPTSEYVDVLKMVDARFGGMPIFNHRGEILSADRIHLTRAGAVEFASFLFDDPAWRAVLSTEGTPHPSASAALANQHLGASEEAVVASLTFRFATIVSILLGIALVSGVLVILAKIVSTRIAATRANR